jgi:hypothetical protein
MIGEETRLRVDYPQERLARSWVLAMITALYCLIVVILFAASQLSLPGSSIWPFPGLYFIEIFLLGCLGLTSLIKNAAPGRHGWTSLPWVGAGGLFAFVILGAWTIGFFLIPAMILSIAVGIFEDRRKKDNLPLHVILFLAAAIAQAAIVFLVLSADIL